MFSFGATSQYDGHTSLVVHRIAVLTDALLYTLPLEVW